VRPTNGVKIATHSQSQSSNQTKKEVGATPTQHFQPNMRRVGAVPKTRVGSARLPRLSNQTHGYFDTGLKHPIFNKEKSICYNPQLYMSFEFQPSFPKPDIRHPRTRKAIQFILLGGFRIYGDTSAILSVMSIIWA
jgi:hypothetical protein